MRIPRQLNLSDTDIRPILRNIHVSELVVEDFASASYDNVI